MSKHDTLAPVVAAIASQLGETQRAAQAQIRRILRALGPERTVALVMQALEVENAGGLRVADGSRRRTPGGVFFQLAKQQTPFVRRSHRMRRLVSRPLEPLHWATRMDVIRPVLNEKGAIDEVKITLVGRPGRVIRRATCMILAMEQARGPSLPRGLPPIPPSPTPYVVYIARKDWPAVETVLADPEDSLMVDGWAAYDPELEGIAVFAMQVSTLRTRVAQQGGE